MYTKGLITLADQLFKTRRKKKVIYKIMNLQLCQLSTQSQLKVNQLHLVLNWEENKEFVYIVGNRTSENEM